MYLSPLTWLLWCSGNLDWYINKPAFSGKSVQDRNRYNKQWQAPLARKLNREMMRKLMDTSLPDDLIIQMHKKLIENKQGKKNRKEFDDWMDELYTEHRLFGWIKKLLDVPSKQQLMKDYPWIQSTMWMQFMAEAKVNKKSAPESVQRWCNQMNTHKVQVEVLAKKNNMSVAQYVVHRATEHSQAGLFGDVQRDQVLVNPGTNEAAHFNFLTGSVDKFADFEFGKTEGVPGLPLDKVWDCPYIFMDVPQHYDGHFAEEHIQLGLKAAMKRTRAASGIVVIFCQDYQIQTAKEACKEVCPTFGADGGQVISVITHLPVDPKKGGQTDFFPGRMYFAVVSFWGDFAPVQGELRYNEFPTQLLVDGKFLATGLQDCIFVPAVGRHVMRAVENMEATAKMVRIPLCVGTGEVVCHEQKPLELYLYFLRAFQFPSTRVVESCVFDLCSGAGTGALAASYLGYESVAVDISMKSNEQAVHRMKLVPKSVHEALGARDIVFDNMFSKGVTFKKPDPNDTPMHLKGTWLQHETFATRFADSLSSNITEPMEAVDHDEMET